MRAWKKSALFGSGVVLFLLLLVFQFGAFHFSVPSRVGIPGFASRNSESAPDLSSASTKNPVLLELVRREQERKPVSALPHVSATVAPIALPSPPPMVVAPPPPRSGSASLLSLRNRGHALAVLGKEERAVFKRNVRAMTLPASVLLAREVTAKRLRECGWPKLASMFEATYTNTLETTVSFVNDGSVFVITGDIDHMWLRDSAAQVSHYIDLAKEDVHVQILIEGVIRRQIHFIAKDKYANSFKISLNTHPTPEDNLLRRQGHVATGNYELDSLCYFLRLSYLYWEATKDFTREVFDDEWIGAVKTIVDVMIVEQDHSKSPYTYIGIGDELPPKGRGSPVGFTGMTWSGFRPSDDACKYGYLIPANAMAVTTLEWAAVILRALGGEVATNLADRAHKLSEQIDDGIHKFGVKEMDGFGKVYAFEVDGLGNFNMMDDANVPSLLSLDYLQYKSRHDPTGVITANTRRWVLSKNNPYLFEGGKFRGIGSPHTPKGNIWPMGITVEALTSNNKEEVRALFQQLADSDAGTNKIHESFNAANPSSFTRHWFAWANSLFAEAIVAKFGLLCPK